MNTENIKIKISGFLRRNFTGANFLPTLITSVIVSLVILCLSAGIIYAFRAEIFDYFAKEYLEKEQRVAIEGKDTEKKEETKQPLLSQDAMVVSAVKKTNPAVVSIVITKNVPKYELYTPNRERNPFGNLFPDFFFSVPEYRQKGTEEREVGGGSGFFVSANGLIVTNRHVVDQSDAEYTVFTNDGKKHAAKVAARDPVLDIAILKIEPPVGGSFPYLSFGNSDSLEVGQTVIAIGNALAEYRNTVSVGVVSGLARSVVAGDSSGNQELLDHVIQTDAAINPGNSGGPLLDLSGRVIGVNVALAQGSQNVGFALPINSVKSSVESVKATGKIVRPYLGVRYITINAEIKEKNNLSVDYGVLVKAGATESELAVIPGSAADKAGIVENDIILEVDGMKLNEENTLASVIRQKKVGDMVTLKILHKGDTKTVKATLGEAKGE